MYKIITDLVKLIPFIYQQNKSKNILNRIYWYNVLRGLFRTVIINLVISKKYDDHLIILEPGYLTQILGACIYTSVNKEDIYIKRIINKIHISDIVVVLFVDPKVSMDRFMGRKRGAPKRMKGLNRNSQMKVIENANIMSRKLAKYSSNKGSTIIFINVNTHSLENLINDIAGEISNIIKNDNKNLY